MLVCNVGLFRQNQALKDTLSNRTQPTHLKPGDVVPPLRGVDSYGNQFTLQYSGSASRTLLFVFSPHCGWCEKNMPNWRSIVDGADRNQLRIVAVSTVTSDAKDYTEGIHLASVPTIVDLEPGDKDIYRLTSTPQTILIDSSGRVERIWVGALTEEQMKDFRSFVEAKPT